MKLNPVSLAFEQEDIEAIYDRDMKKNDVPTLRFFFKFMYAYLAIRLGMEFFGVSSLPINITVLKLMVILASHLYTYLGSCRGWHLRAFSLFISYLLVDLIVRDPSYPGFYFVLVENQIIQGILFLRNWKQHLIFCTIEMCYLLFVFHQSYTPFSLPRLTVHILGLLVLHTGGIWVYEREIRLRWMAQRNLSQQEVRWRNMMSLLSDPVLVATVDQVVYVNQAATVFTGSEQHTAMQKFEKLVSERQLGALRDLLSDGMHGAVHSWEEFEFKTMDGEHKNIEISSTTVDWDGKKAAMLVGHDVTEIRRTQKLKDSFLAACSHELRTPLNSIMGMLELIQEQSEGTSVVQKYAVVAFQSGQHLLNLINDILDLSKIAAGKFELNVLPFNLFSIAEKTLHMVTYQASQRDTKLLRSFDPKLSCVLLGDPCRFRQVLLNLLSNAIKFTMSGEIRVELRIDGSDDNDWADAEVLTVRCDVKDTGMGIKEGDLDKLFSLFGKMKSHNHLNPSGSGLGLALCKELCAQMGGEIGVDTEWGKGSTFWFTMQLRRRPEDVHKSLSQCQSSKPLRPFKEMKLEAFSPPGKSTVNQLPDNSSRKQRVLLVEDNDFNIAVMTALLQSRYEVIEARNGQVAVDLFSREPTKFDLILMDCQMPVLDGFEATKEILQIIKKEHVAKVPIVGLTASAMEGDREKCLAAGMDDYLSKPVSKHVLYQTIERWLPRAPPVDTHPCQ